MNELKPIEVGCRAMIINAGTPENNNKIVTVLKCLGRMTALPSRKKGVVWKIDRLNLTLGGIMSDLIMEDRLMRIDDPDLKEEKEEEELLLIEDES